MDRFEDKNIEIYSFANEVIIVCPKCSKKAFVINKKNAPQMICSHCGLNKSPDNINVTTVGVPFDPYFNEELFLKIDCCGNILFAFNKDHLQYIKDYVSSKLRERNKSEKLYMKNRSMISRLPAWIKDKKNRDDILKKIRILEQKLLDEHGD